MLVFVAIFMYSMAGKALETDSHKNIEKYTPEKGGLWNEDREGWQISRNLINRSSLSLI